MNDILVGDFTVTPQDNRIQLGGHGLVNDDRVRFASGSEPINALPTPLVENTYYFVVGARLSDFQVALTQGGAVIDITDPGVGGTNEVWEYVPDEEPQTYERQMTSTITHDITNEDFAMIKLLN